MRWKRLLVAITIGAVMQGCGSGGGDAVTSASVSVQTAYDIPLNEAEKRYLHDLFLTEYLWYDQVPYEVDYTAFTTPMSMIYALRAPQDRWSFAVTQEEYDAYLSQSTQGIGIAYDETFRIILTAIGSPADGKLFRGDRILLVNGTPPTVSLLESVAADLGTPVTFRVERDGAQLDVSVTPSRYIYRTVKFNIFEYGGKKVGYLRYDAFSSSSAVEIEAAFTVFKLAGVEELVIDLRYNGGGMVTAASILLDNITNRYPGRVQMVLDWNENYKFNNETYTFEDADEQDGNELSLSRVYFLTTRYTASASEAVIHALKPYLGNGVVTVGDTTEGKNVGMSGKVHGDIYYFLVNFYIKNAAGEISSSAGIAPTCPAPDDISHRFGDPNEAMLHEALVHMTTGGC